MMNYQTLIRELALTDFKLKYQGSVLGYLWSFAKPLVLFTVLYVVFTKFVKFGAGIDNYAMYLLLGIVLWSYFAESTSTAMTSIVDRSDLIRKVSFPQSVIIVAASISSLITLVLNLIVVTVFAILSGAEISVFFPLTLVLLLELYILSIGCAFLLSALFVKFRDFRHIWELALQVLFYATPIIYPLSMVPEKVAAYLLLNPVAQIIQDSRRLLVTPSTTTTSELLSAPLTYVPYAIPFLILLIGYLYFKKSSYSFAEEL